VRPIKLRITVEPDLPGSRPGESDLILLQDRVAEIEDHNDIIPRPTHVEPVKNSQLESIMHVGNGRTSSSEALCAPKLVLSEGDEVLMQAKEAGEPIFSFPVHLGRLWPDRAGGI